MTKKFYLTKNFNKISGKKIKVHFKFRKKKSFFKKIKREKKIFNKLFKKNRLFFCFFCDTKKQKNFFGTQKFFNMIFFCLAHFFVLKNVYSFCNKSFKKNFI